MIWRLLLLAIFIPEDKISEIKNTVDIVDIVSETVLLKKTGRNFVGLSRIIGYEFSCRISVGSSSY